MILDDIVHFRKEQLEREMSAVSFEEIKKAAEKIDRPCKGFGKALKAQGLSVIAEVKKASPSKGLIQPDFHPAENGEAYEKAGAAAISCLTEEHYFMGSSDYFRAVREKVSIPMLRKDFIIEPYQIYEARVMGADAVLLIAALLDTQKMSEYRKIAESLDLDVLAESHDEYELDSVLNAGCSIVGVNNRNLKTFEVSLDTTKKLLDTIPKDYVRVSESGIKNNEDMRIIRSYGADAVLIGETLMRSGLDGIADCMKSLKEGLYD